MTWKRAFENHFATNMDSGGHLRWYWQNKSGYFCVAVLRRVFWLACFLKKLLEQHEGNSEGASTFCSCSAKWLVPNFHHTTATACKMPVAAASPNSEAGAPGMELSMWRHCEERTVSKALLIDGHPACLPLCPDWLKIATPKAVGADSVARCLTIASHLDESGSGGSTIKFCIGLCSSYGWYWFLGGLNWI